MELTPATSEMYPDPLSFNPDRFLDSDKNRREGINEIPDAAFGFGRRSDKSYYLYVSLGVLIKITTECVQVAGLPLIPCG